MAIDRRRLIGTAIGAALWPGSNRAQADTTKAGDARLVVVLLRGAVDGLSVVAPYAETAYYRRRPSIAIAPPGSANGALRLDARFGLHPALAELLPLWQAGQLAFVHAAGSPDPTRSHFDAQLYLENGTPGQNRTADGWMNRLLLTLPGPRHPIDAIAVGPTLPAILRGRAPAANLPLSARGLTPSAIDRPEIGGAFDRLYAGGDALGAAYRASRSAHGELVADLDAERRMADNGAPPPRGFALTATRLAQMMARDPRIRLAVVALGGWDTHVGQGASRGPLADRLRALGAGLAAFAREAGAAWRETVIVVLSEFGRTVAENGNGGTDHGHGNVVWLVGGAVSGGRVYGGWPGLAPAALDHGRDLPVVTDFRSILAVALERHLGISPEACRIVFPGLPPPAASLAPIVAAR
jgi:uncharacterized protein (DUF1501 family)